MKRQPMPATWQAEQARHDALHPGKVCQQCPTTQWDYVETGRMNERWERHERIRARIQVVFALAVLLGCWLLSGLVR